MRKGVRLTFSSAASCSSVSRVPAGISPVTMRRTSWA